LKYLRPKYASINEKPRRLAGLELPGVVWAFRIRNANRATIPN
jgi:hypothetical protein